MHKLDDIKSILRKVIWSAYIKDEEQPVSALLCCKPEAGKTILSGEAKKLDGIIYPTDMTAYGILKMYAPDILSRKVRHILIPDIITPLSKRYETSSTFVAFLNQLIEEGILEIRTYAMSVKYPYPVKCGVIACVTPDKLKDKRHRWAGMGFMSRMLPISWSYNEERQDEIFEFIAGREYRKDTAWNYTMPQDDIEVELPVDLAKQLIPYSKQFSKANDTYGFRYQKHLQRLAMASAIIRGDKIATQEDIDEIIYETIYLNLDGNAI